MIKALGRTGDGRPLLILGVSGEGMTRLMAGEPITLDPSKEFTDSHIEAPAVQIVLVGGKDESAILANLKRAGLITAGTKDLSEHPAATD